MPISRGATWCAVLFFATALATSIAPVLAQAVEPASAEKQIVEVKVWVVEVSIGKLRNLGFDWDVGWTSVRSHKSAPAIDDQKFLGFLEALEQSNLARTHARPQIATQSGLKATLDISPHLKVEVTPTVSDAEHIDLTYLVDVATARDEPHSNQRRRLVSACSTELKAGTVQLLSETAIQRRTAKGELAQSKLLVLAEATIVK